MNFLVTAVGILYIWKVGAENSTLEDFIAATQNKLNYLEERIVSLELPAWTISWDSDRWQRCSSTCECIHMTKTLNCWNKLEDVGVPDSQLIPWDVHYLDVGNNNLNSIPKDGFRGLGKLLELSIANAKLKYIPRFSFRHLSDLKYLKIPDNEISWLEGDLLRAMTKLKHFDASSNLIVEIPTRFFSSTTQLETLQMSNNKIRDLSSCPFRTLTTLKSLDLSRNSIQILGHHCFENMKSLEEIDLSQNHLTEIKMDNFHGLLKGSLKSLNLQRNRIESLEEHSFASLSNLKMLDLSHNQIKTFDPSILSPSVENLNICKNLIDRVKRAKGSPFLVLKTLELCSNNLESIPKPVVADQFPNLETLNLNDNIIQQFEQMITLPANLKMLNIGKNQLEYLTESDLQELSRLNKIELGGNFWRCDCTNFPFARWIQENPQKRNIDDVIRCFSPDEFESQELSATILKTYRC